MSFWAIPGVAPAAIAAGGAVASSLLGRQSTPSLSAQRNSQLEYDKMSIQARIEGAKAAGIHPLAALGMSPSSWNPAIASSAPAGREALSEGIRAGTNAYMQRPQDLRTPEQLRMDRANADLAELNALEAKRKLAAQPGNPPPLVKDGTKVDYAVAPGNAGVVEGYKPLWQRHMDEDGRIWYSPSDTFKESVEDLPMALQAVMAARNAKELEHWNSVRDVDWQRRRGALSAPRFRGPAITEEQARREVPSYLRN